MPKGEFTSVVTKGKSGNRGPESDAAHEVHNSPSELRHLGFHYKRFLSYFHFYSASIVSLTICDHSGLCIETVGFYSEAGDFPPRAIGDNSYPARQSFLLAPTMCP